MKNFVRIITLILALMMVGFGAVACTTIEITEVINDELDQNGRKWDDLPDTLKYNETVSTLYWSDCGKPEFEEEKLTNDNVRDAIYDRNNNIQRRLKVELEFTGIPGNVNNRTNFVKRVVAEHETGSTNFDLIASYARTIGTLSTQGLLVNFGDIPEDSDDPDIKNYINRAQPWWPVSMVDTVTFGEDSYYFISGDCSTNILYQMEGLYFNKDEINRRFNQEAANYVAANPDKADKVVDGTTMLYDLVREGKWTLDKLIEMTTDVWVDKDQDNQKSDSDFYGFVSTWYNLDAFYTGSNLRYIEKDAEKTLKISSDYGSSKTVALVQKVGKWLNTNDGYINDATYTTIFKNKGAMFILVPAQYGEQIDRAGSFEFGIVPGPKYNEKQLNYYTKTGNPISLYSIFIDCPDHFGDGVGKERTLSMLSAVLECWCSEGYRLTTPEIFEVNMQLKMSETDDETQMFEYVRSGITYDLGRFFTYDISNMHELPDYAMQAGTSWANTYTAYKSRLEKQLEAVVETFQNGKKNVVVTKVGG